MELSSIRIMGMHKVDDKTYELNKHKLTYFFGKNGAGKSTILQAIQLALLGYIPGTNKTNSAIFKHANGPRLMVELKLSGESNVSICREWVQVKGGVESTVTTSPQDLDIEQIIGDISLPIFNFNDFIGMTANKLKDWFINFLPEGDDSIDWSSQLHKALEEANFVKVLVPDFVDECIAYVNSLPQTGLEQVRAFNTYLKDQQSFKKGELSRIQSTIQSLILYEDCDNSYTIEEIQQKLNELNILKTSASEKLLLIGQNNNALIQMKQYENMITAEHFEGDSYAQKLKSDIANLQLRRAEVERSMTNAQYIKAQCEAELNSMKSVLSSQGQCPYTHKQCESITNMVSEFEDRATSLKADIDKCTENINNHTLEINLCKSEEYEYRTKLDTLQQAYTNYNRYKSQLHQDVIGVSFEDVSAQVDNYTAEINKFTDTLAKLKANKQYNELTNKLTAEKYELEQSIEILKIWIKLTDVNGLQTTMMNAPFEKLAVSVTSILNTIVPNSVHMNQAAFMLSTKANSFSFGIKNAAGDYIEYDLLSSGEKCIYMLALLISLVRNSTTSLPLILIDDLLDHLDDEYINDAFTALSNIEGVQLILAGVKPCNISDSVYGV